MDHAKMQTVQSGIGLNELSLESGARSAPASFITSRTARVLLAGVGFLADAYDLFVMNVVLVLLKEEYPEFTANNSIHFLEGVIAAAALVGSITGQLVAGSLADIIGRKKIFVATALFISVGSICSACCYNSPSMNIYYQISFWRFFLGVGVGGEYPLAATVTSESSSPTRRGALMAAVFSMQGVGAILSVLVVITCLKSGASNNFTWRFALGFGAVPAALAFPYRLRMHETESFDRVKKDRAAASATGLSSNNNNNADSSHGMILINASRDSHDNAGTGNRDRTDTWGSHVSLNSESGDMETSYGAVQMMQRSVITAASTGSGGGGGGYAKVSLEESTHGRSALSAKNPLLRAAHSRSGIDISELDNTTSRNVALTSASSISPKDLAALTSSHGEELYKAWIYYKWHLLGTALCWFLLDVDFYANNLFNHDITQSILLRHNPDGSAVTATPLVGAYNSAILYLFAIPGYLLSITYIDSLGRRNIQLMGFTMMAALFLICTLSYDALLLAPPDAPFASGRKYVYLLLYALTFLFSNFGPNTTSFVIPGEIYPSEVRATCHGVSAAAGKLGAATGAYFFPTLSVPPGASEPTPEGIKLVMAICCLVALAGVLVTYFCIPQYRPRDLVFEGKYHALSHRCLRPNDTQLALLGDRYWEEPASRAGEEEEQEEEEAMVQIVERCDNYELGTTMTTLGGEDVGASGDVESAATAAVGGDDGGGAIHYSSSPNLRGRREGIERTDDVSPATAMRTQVNARSSAGRPVSYSGLSTNGVI